MKKILILAGGYSKERDISIKTGKEVAKALKKKYKVKILDPKGDFINQIKDFNPNVVFNALHGRDGEDGYIQTILENEKIKYTHSGVRSSSIAIDKDVSKKIFIKNNILTPKYFIFSFDKKKSSLIKLIEKKTKISSSFKTFE